MKKSEWKLWKSSAQVLDDWEKYYERQDGGVRNVERINDRLIKFDYYYIDDWGNEVKGTNYAADVHIRPPSKRFMNALRERFGDSMFNREDAWSVYKELNPGTERGFGKANMSYEFGRAASYGCLEIITNGWYMFPLDNGDESPCETCDEYPDCPIPCSKEGWV